MSASPERHGAAQTGGSCRVCVLGLGNVLMGDDGVGPHLLKLLEAGFAFPDSVQLLDAGTPGLDLTPFLAESDVVIVVDAVRAAGAPGEVRVFDEQRVLERSPALVLGPHDPGLREALLTARLAGVAPKRLVVVGVIPERVETGTHLSQAVRSALPAALERLLAELRCAGVDAKPRELPARPDLWWERT